MTCSEWIVLKVCNLGLLKFVEAVFQNPLSRFQIWQRYVTIELPFSFSLFQSGTISMTFESKISLFLSFLWRPLYFDLEQLVWHLKVRFRYFFPSCGGPFHFYYIKRRNTDILLSHLICNIRSSGFSMNRFHSLQNLATVAPSRTLWSAPMLTWPNRREG